MAEHLTDYVRYLAGKGNTPEHVELTEARVRACLDGCRFVRVADLQPSAVIGFLAELRNPSTGEGGQTVLGKSIATANHYLTAVKGFTRWLWRDRRIGSDPFAGMAKLANTETDLRHARRDFSSDELAALLEAARDSDMAFRGLTGFDRFMLYLTAVGTGFRVSELASLTPESFDLDAVAPTARVDAAYSKNRKQAVQPLPADVADALRGYLKAKAPGEAVWPGTWHQQASAKMLRADLREARATWLSAVRDERQRAEMETTTSLPTGTPMAL